MPRSKLKNTIHTALYDSWQTDWILYDAARQSKFFLGSPDSVRTRSILQHGRHKFGRLVRILTGHNALAYFKNKVDPEIDPYCRFCEEHEYETFIHLITTCPTFENIRRDVFQQQIFPSQTWRPYDVLRFADTSQIQSALDGFLDGVHYGED